MEEERLKNLVSRYFPESHKHVKPIKKNFKNLDHSLKDIYDNVGFENLSKQTLETDEVSVNKK